MAPECLRRTQLSEVGWQSIPHSWSNYGWMGGLLHLVQRGGDWAGTWVTAGVRVLNGRTPGNLSNTVQ